MKSILIMAALAIGSSAWAAPAAPANPSKPAAAPTAAPVQTRDVPASQFMQGRVPANIALNIPVPVQYAQSGVQKMGYSYWMRPADAATATAASLPNRHGYMYGSTATNVTYDVRTRMFYGIDDPGSLDKMKAVATNIQIKPFKEAKNPAVLVTMTSGTTGQPAYFMYMSTGVKNEVFFLSFRAPDGRPDIGDAVWAKLAANIK